MALRLIDIFESKKEEYALKCITGDIGLNEAVTWMHLAEDASTTESIRGGEIIITTGMQKKLSELIKNCHANDAKALIVNTGKYINSIDEDKIGRAHV